VEWSGMGGREEGGRRSESESKISPTINININLIDLHSSSLSILTASIDT
jgi:hypothetical protein